MNKENFKVTECQTMKSIVERIEGAELQDKKGGKLRFRLHMTDAMSETSIEALDLSVRSYNCLKRAGYNKISDITDALAGGVELKDIRNCGTRSVREIKEKLFLFQYESLPEHKREDYLKEVVGIN